MFVHNIDPVLLKLGAVEIRYYGLVYVLGFLALIWHLSRLSEKGKLGLSRDDVYDFMIYLMVGGLLGARMWEVFVYNAGYYLSNPFEIIAIWHGGMAFHGGLLGGTIAAWLFIKKKNIRFYEIADNVILMFPLVLFFGRIANFLNGELYGIVTDVPWAVKFPGAEGFRHPSQLYEAVKNLFIFGTLMYVKSRKPRKGMIFWLFVTMYGFLRFVIEFWREPGTVWFGISAGQILSFVMFLIGLYVLINSRRKR